MAATWTQTRVGTKAWRTTIETGTAPYKWYLDGVLVWEGSETTREDSTTDNAEPPAYEIQDANDTAVAQNLQHPPRVRLQWRGDVNADHYRVEEYVASTWTTRVRVAERSKGYYTYLSQPKTDGATVQFRVIAVDALGNESVPAAVSVVIVRNPEPPDWTGTYDEGTGDLTIAAA